MTTTTVRTNVVLSETLYVSRAVMRGLRVLAARGDDPLMMQPDAIADAILREHLAGIPELAEREAKIRAFFRELDRESNHEDSSIRLCDQNKRLKDALRHIAEYPNITASAMRDCARETLRCESSGEKGSEPKPGCSHTSGASEHSGGSGQ